MMRILTPLVLVLALVAAGCGGDDNPTGPTDPSVGLNVPFGTTDLVIGTGTEATNGRTLTVNYTLWLYNPTASENKGRQVQSGGPFNFVLGTGNVIQGWHQGIPGMRIGGRRRIVIPPALAYGAQGSPPEIPGNATILFEVELLNVQ
jgi:FKBP-type peptidyl-prolyl cis-trans isomerase